MLAERAGTVRLSKIVLDGKRPITEGLPVLPPSPSSMRAAVNTPAGSAGERDIVGAITKAGDADLRTALYQAATVMLNRGAPNWLKAWALRLAVLRGRKRATVALARRIGVVLHRMWRDGTEFRFTREAAMALRTA